MLAVTFTWDRSSTSSTVSTRPTSTSLYLMTVVPATMPSALSKTIVIEGPRSDQAQNAR